MTLDPRFICSSDLIGVFLDKLTGLPLAAGVLTFYSDVNRSTLKSVYQLTGDGINTPYAFVALTDPIYLNSVGGYEDGSGNSIVIYYFPYFCTIDGDPTTSTGASELYYVTITNSGGQTQATRQAWPPLASNFAPSVNSGNITNYIPNGQFLFYNTPGESAIIIDVNDGVRDNNATQLAQGGWTFQQTNGSSGSYTMSFSTVTGGLAGLNDIPSTYVNFVCNTPGNETVHDLCITWPDANIFSLRQGASPLPTSNPFVFFFAAQSNTLSTTYNFNLYLTTYFGSGGSTATQTLISVTPIAIVPGWKYYSVSVNFPDNSAETVGAGNFISLALRSPTGTACNVSFTDFALIKGTAAPSAFPTQTNANMLTNGVAGWMPTPDPTGQDLYLPLVLTPEGMIFDHSEVGTIVSKMGPAVNNELICDGSYFVTSSYSSSLGIPYSRLFNYLFNNGNSYNIPLFGTGSNFVTAYINSGITSQIVLCTNTNGAQTVTANGTSSPSFTITTPLTGAAGIAYNGWANNAEIVTGFLSSTAPTHSNNGINAGTSGMSVSNYNDPSGIGYNYAFQLTAIAASSLANGSSAAKYFTFSNTSTDFYMWFKTGSETDPAPGGTGILCTLDASMLAPDVAIMIVTALAEYQASYITVGAASTITSGNYFYFYANSVQYNVWYQKDGTGGSPPAGNSIKVAITTGQIAAQVGAATQIAINSYQFAVPDLRGLFLRGFDTGAKWDLDYANRFGIGNFNIAAGNIGSFELSQFESHKHLPASPGTNFVTFDSAGSNAATGGGSTWGAPDFTGATGGPESRPVNISVNFFIKY